jgi:sterol desaturase/sphingolipid hydroxylase (fatty acid hydroxylase superfamily)
MDWRQILVLLLIFVPLERLLPHRHGQRIFRKRWTTDTVYLLVNGLVIRFGFAGILAVAMPLIDRGVPDSLQAYVASQPLWLQVPVAILIADLGFYCHHRLFHAVPFLWRFHAIHHSIQELDWLAAHRVHPVDQLASSSMILLPLFALGFSAEVIAIYGAVYFLQSHLVHSNTRLGYGPLDWLFASPRFHHWHHANAPAAFDRNFGGQTLIWDRLFGTLRMPRDFPSRYGTDDPLPDDYPRQLLAPFMTPRRRFA